MSESTDRKLKVLELFAGTRSIGRAFEERGHEVLSVDWDERFADIDLQMDVLELHADEVLKKLGKPDVMWASPDCITCNIAAISHHHRRDDHIVKICEVKICEAKLYAERRCVTR